MNSLAILDITHSYGGKEFLIHPVVLYDEHEMVLVDSGYPGQADACIEAASCKGISLEKLTKVIITHHDYDHYGSLAEIKRRFPGIQVMASEAESAYISGEKRSLRLEQAEMRFDRLPESRKNDALAYRRVLASVESVDVDVQLKDGDLLPCCGGIRVIGTPGHLPGHICLYIEESKTLITGDALILLRGKLSLANPRYTFDSALARESVRKLLSVDIRNIICYHGGLYEGDVRKGLASLVSAD